MSEAARNAAALPPEGAMLLFAADARPDLSRVARLRQATLRTLQRIGAEEQEAIQRARESRLVERLARGELVASGRPFGQGEEARRDLPADLWRPGLRVEPGLLGARDGVATAEGVWLDLLIREVGPNGREVSAQLAPKLPLPSPPSAAPRIVVTGLWERWRGAFEEAFAKHPDDRGACVHRAYRLQLSRRLLRAKDSPAGCKKNLRRWFDQRKAGLR